MSSGGYADRLRQDAGQTIEVGKHWTTTVLIVRELVLRDDLDAAEKVSEIRALLHGLQTVQADIDATAD